MVLRVAGELTLQEAAELRRTLLDSILDTEALIIVVDLTAITFMDSTAIGVLIGARKRLALQGRDLRLACCQAEVLRTLQLMGLDKVLPVHESVEQACAGTGRVTPTT